MANQDIQLRSPGTNAWDISLSSAEENPPKIYVKVSGAWKNATPYVRVSGVWKIANPSVKISGVWKT